jgi:hypothetical protein
MVDGGDGLIAFKQYISWKRLRLRRYLNMDDPLDQAILYAAVKKQLRVGIVHIDA